jgi:hypothetical protein
MPQKQKNLIIRQMPDNQVLPAAAVTIQLAHFTSFALRLNASR